MINIEIPLEVLTACRYSNIPEYEYKKPKREDASTRKTEVGRLPIMTSSLTYLRDSLKKDEILLNQLKNKNISCI